MGLEKGEEIQTKGIANLFNNFPSLEKGRCFHVQEAYRIPNNQDQKRNTTRLIIIKTLNIQNKKRILKVAKEKRHVTYKETHKNNSRFINTISKCKKVMERDISGPESKQPST
jgi:hypothetical protein